MREKNMQVILVFYYFFSIFYIEKKQFNGKGKKILQILLW